MELTQMQPTPFILNMKNSLKGGKNQHGNENRRYNENPVKFPITKAILWNREPIGSSLAIQFLQKKELHVVVCERALQLAFHHGRQIADGSFNSFLIGCLETDHNDIVLQLDRFDPGRETDLTTNGNAVKKHCPTTLVPGDLAVPLKVIQGLRHDEDDPSMSEEELSQSFKYLSGRIKSQESINLPHLIVSRICCFFQSDINEILTDFTCNVAIFNTLFKLIPIRAVPIIPTALARNLTGPMRLSAVQHQAKFGYLTMDHTRKLLLVLETDPKVQSLPLIGIWVSGVEDMSSCFIWACLMKFVNNEMIKERVLAPPHNFLLVCYLADSSQPVFYECQQETLENEQNRHELYECQEEFFLKPHAHDLAQKEIEFILKKVTHGPMNDNFSDLTKQQNRQGTRPEPKGKHGALEEGKESQRGANTSRNNQRMPADTDEALPSPHPSPKPHPLLTKPMPALPMVPELSFFESETPSKTYNPAAYQQKNSSLDKSGSEQAGNHTQKRVVHHPGSSVEKKITDVSDILESSLTLEGTHQSVIARLSQSTSSPEHEGESGAVNTDRNPYELIADQQKQLIELKEQVLQLLKEKASPVPNSVSEKEDKGINQGPRTEAEVSTYLECTATNTGESLINLTDKVKVPERISLGINTGESLLLHHHTNKPDGRHQQTNYEEPSREDIVQTVVGTTDPRQRIIPGIKENTPTCCCQCRCLGATNTSKNASNSSSFEQQHPQNTQESVAEPIQEERTSLIALDSPTSDCSRIFRAVQASQCNQSMNETMKSELIAVDVPDYDDSTMSPVKGVACQDQTATVMQGESLLAKESASMCEAEQRDEDWVEDGRCMMAESSCSPKTFISENLSDGFYRKMMEQVKELLEHQRAANSDDDDDDYSSRLEVASINGSSTSETSSGSTELSEDKIVSATVKELHRITDQCLTDGMNSSAVHFRGAVTPMHPKVEYQSLLGDQSFDTAQHFEIKEADAIAMKYLSHNEAHELRKQSRNETTKTVKFHGVFEKAMQSQWKTSLVSLNVSCNMSIATKQYLKKYDLLDSVKEPHRTTKRSKPKAVSTREEIANTTQPILNIRKLKNLPKLL